MHQAQCFGFDLDFDFGFIKLLLLKLLKVIIQTGSRF